MKRTLLLLIVLCVSWPATAQKRALDHDVYDSWNSLGQTRISDDGNWFMYMLNPQEGDSRLIIQERNANRIDTLHRVSRLSWSADAAHSVFFISPTYAQTREARIKKVKREDMPKDTLGIYTLATRELVKIADVKSFKMPEKGFGWVAYHKEKEKPVRDTTRANGNNRQSNGDSAFFDDDVVLADGNGKAKRGEGTTLVLRNLKTGSETSFKFVSDYVFEIGRAHV